MLNSDPLKSYLHTLDSSSSSLGLTPIRDPPSSFPPMTTEVPPSSTIKSPSSMLYSLIFIKPEVSEVLVKVSSHCFLAQQVPLVMWPSKRWMFGISFEVMHGMQYGIFFFLSNIIASSLGRELAYNKSNYQTLCTIEQIFNCEDIWQSIKYIMAC